MATLIGQRIVVEKTYAQMAALILAAELNPFLWYKITDRGDRGLVFRAAATDRLESDGIRYMLCPTTYATGLDAYDNDWIGVWNATKQATATTGQLCIWNGLVWVAGETMDGNAPDTEASGWTVIPKASFTNHEYVEMIFNVCYDFDEDWICEQSKNGNIFGGDKTTVLDVVGFQVVDVCDWNYATNGKLFTNNRCVGIFNNSGVVDIFGNTNYGVISNNNTTGSISQNKNEGDIKYNTNDGQISGNKNNGMIALNSNDGSISNNDNNGFILSNSNFGSITDNRNNGNIESNSSLAETTCDIKTNINNGNITGVWDADVTDTVVDKTGTAEPTTTL